jgi:hypothetical protein
MVLQMKKCCQIIKDNATQNTLLFLASREDIVDSGASLHLVDPRELTDEELKTKRKDKQPIDHRTANAVANATHECKVTIAMLNNSKLGCALLKGTPPLISQGRLTAEYNYGFVDVPGDDPYLIKQDGPTIYCKTTQYAPPVVPATSKSERGL